MSPERAIGTTFIVLGAAGLIYKLVEKPKLEWEWSDTTDALLLLLLILAGLLARATGPKK